MPLVSDIDWRLGVWFVSFPSSINSVFSSILSINLCLVLISWEKWLQLTCAQGKWGKIKTSAFYQVATLSRLWSVFGMCRLTSHTSGLEIVPTKRKQFLTLLAPLTGTVCSHFWYYEVYNERCFKCWQSGSYTAFFQHKNQSKFYLSLSFTTALVDLFVYLFIYSYICSTNIYWASTVCQLRTQWWFSECVQQTRFWGDMPARTQFDCKKTQWKVT